MDKKRRYILLGLIALLLNFSCYSSNSKDSLVIDQLHKLLKEAESYRVKSFDKCLEIATEAQELAKQNNKIKELAEATKTIGIAYFFQGNYSEAIQHYNEAQGYYKLIGDLIGVAKINNNIGIIYQRWTEYDSAYHKYMESLKIYENVSDTLNMAGALNNLGNIEILLGKNEDAIAHFKRAYEIFVQYSNLREQANVLNNIGYVYEKIDENDKALKYYNTALKIRKEIIDNYGIGVSLNNIGVIYFKKKDYTKALSYFFKALNTREELGHFAGITATLTLIGQTYAEMNNITNATNYLNKALEFAIQEGLNERRLNIYEIFYDMYSINKNFEKAFFYQQKYMLLKDSIFSEEKLAQIEEIEERYQKEKNQKEIEILKIEKEIHENEIRKQKLFRNILVLFFLSILGMAIWILNRNRIILSNKKKLELQNQTISKQHEKIIEINKNITDSIIYSKQLLNSVLPQKDYLNDIFPEHFIINKPKDIVSGDFYWIKKNKSTTYIAIADCTGHGVPGAIMSMLGISFLNEIIGQKTKIVAHEILNQLRDKVIETLHQTGKKKENKDGIDIALCVIDNEKKILQFSGAYNSAFLIINNELLTLKGEKKPIGIYVTEKESFKSQDININPGDRLYMSTDGFFHQFGGEKTTKFSSNSFKKLLTNIHQKPFEEQEKIIETTIETWKGNLEQVDDILVFGAKII